MFLVCTGKVTKKPVVVNDKIEIREMMSTVWTIDHRFGDATLACKFINIIKGYVEDPENFDITQFPEAPTYNQERTLKNE
jgi:pyruvate/2-oxoglutarate dehydrogenase complex dihydrolipoamide acyltransferase (E2) component